MASDGLERRVLISEAEIMARLPELARDIKDQHEEIAPGEGLLLIGVLKGAAMFTTDLMRALDDVGLENGQVDFIQISSYGQNTQTSGEPKVFTTDKDLETMVSGRHVAVVEDMVDTGTTLKVFLEMVKDAGALSLQVFVLLCKTGAQVVEVQVDHIGFYIGADDWIDGYGIDTANKGRYTRNVMKVITS